MKACVRCKAEFGCGADEGKKTCWCEELPAVMPVTDEGCLCPACLRQEVEARVGLCGSCGSAKVLATKTGAAIFQCQRSAVDASFPKFPPLPMKSCSAYSKK